jgi:hypothetical protein
MCKKQVKIEKVALLLLAATIVGAGALALSLGTCGPGSVIYGSPESLNVHEKVAAPFGSGVVYEEDELGVCISFPMEPS